MNEVVPHFTSACLARTWFDAMPKSAVLIVDDDSDVRDSLRALLESAAYAVREYDSARKVLADPAISEGGCLIADIRMPDMDGLQLQEELSKRRVGLPVIIVTGHGDVPLAVRAMKAGAVDFIEKPFDGELMLDSVGRALAFAEQTRSKAEAKEAAGRRIALLTPRELDVLKHLVAGRSNKVIAYELGISPRTVEIHRGHLMEKIQARSLSDLIRMALAAGIEAGKSKG
jgi:two-component system, LuxR family, response regulator FixJ